MFNPIEPGVVKVPIFQQYKGIACHELVVSCISVLYLPGVFCWLRVFCTWLDILLRY